MLADKPVLIVADNIYLALDLAAAVELAHGKVIGPACTVVEALALLDHEEVEGAVIDAELDDGGVAPIVKALAEKGVPYVIQTSRIAGRDMMMIEPEARVLTKPIQPSDVISVLAQELWKTERY